MALLWPRWSQGHKLNSSLQSNNSLSKERMISGKKKEIWWLLEVGTLDIPIPSLPERPASGSVSLPSTSSAPPPFSGSTPSEASSCCWVNGWFPWILDYGQARRFPLGSSRGTRKIPKRQSTSRTTTSMPVPGRDPLPSWEGRRYQEQRWANPQFESTFFSF